MNKVCLVLSLGLLMNGQQILGRTMTALEQAEQAHEIAKREYSDSVNELNRIKKLHYVTNDDIERAEQDHGIKFHKYQKTEKDLAAIRKQLENEEKNRQAASALAVQTERVRNDILAQFNYLNSFNRAEAQTLSRELYETYKQRNRWW